MGELDGRRLAEWAAALRTSTLRRLEAVPAGHENDRVGEGAMSFADLARHLVDADLWLERKLCRPELAAMRGGAGGEAVGGPGEWRRLLDELARSGERRSRLLAGLGSAELERVLPDERFGGEVPAWWVVVRGNLEHEAHHRGQIAAGLRAAGVAGDGRPEPPPEGRAAARAAPAPLRSFTPAAKTAELVAELERRGALIVRRLVDEATVRAIRAELAGALAAAGTGDEQSGFATRRLDAVLARSRSAAELVVEPLVLAVAEAVLGPRCIHFQLGSTQAVEILPGESATPFHRDDDLYPFERPGPQHQIGALWALTDFTADNGATRVVPGSHRWDDRRRPRDDEAVASEMPAGSLMIQMGSTWHSGGANRTRQARTALVFNYVLGWLRQEENQYLAVPQEIARGLPEAVQKLMGYRSHGRMLGYYEGQDPEWI